MILRQPEKINLRGIIGSGEERPAVKPIIMQEIKRRPKEIGNQHGFKTPPQKLPVLEGRGKVQTVEEPEGGDKKENGYAEARDDFKERDKVNIGRGVEQILGTGMNSHDAKHCHAAYVLD